MNNEFSAGGLIPLKMASAAITLDEYCEGWELALFLSAPEPAPRSFEHQVRFDAPFSNLPLVQVSLTGFDIDSRDTARLSVHAEEITSEGFKLVIKTWMHTRVYRVDVSWIALGS